MKYLFVLNVRWGLSDPVHSQTYIMTSFAAHWLHFLRHFYGQGKVLPRKYRGLNYICLIINTFKQSEIKIL